MKTEYYIDRFKINFSQDYSERQTKLALLEKIYNGSIYDNLPPFYQEYGNSVGSPGGYIPLAERRPSVKYKIAKIIVNELASMLFGESHFPQIRASDKNDQNTSEFLQKITRQSNLRLVMINAVKIGSVGSVAIVVKYLEGQFCFEVLKTKYLTPVFNQFNNTILESLLEKKILTGKQLSEMGYQIKEEDERKDFCLMREWLPDQEIYYLPYKLEDQNNEKFTIQIDEDKSTDHNLGFVPVVWIKNPDEEDASDVDGACIFEDIIDNGIEIDYQLSQHGRLLKYNSDPTLVIKDPSSLMNDQLIKGTGALKLGADSDAKYLQLDSQATDAVLAYVKQIRQMSIEVVRGDRANPDKLLAGNSGKALQMLNKPMISLVDELRISYGEIGLLNIYKMIFSIATNENIDTQKLNINVNADSNNDLILDWPQFYPVTEQDKSTTANTLKTLTDSGNLSHKTAITSIADDYNIQSVDDEIKEIAVDQAALAAQAPKVSKVINA